MIIRGDEPIFIHRKTESSVDVYGNPTFTTSEILVRDCLFWFGSSNEPVDVARDPIDARLTIVFPKGTEILDGDEFEIRETMWVKDGEAQEWLDVFPAMETGVVVNVRRRNG